MSLVTFRRSPLENFLTTNFLDFNPNNLFNDRLWLKSMNEPALNIKEKNDQFEIELAAPGFNKKDFENLAYFEPFYLKDFIFRTTMILCSKSLPVSRP